MKNRFVIGCIVLSALVSATGFAFFMPQQPVSSPGAVVSAGRGGLALKGALEGFEPGSKVAYTVIPEQGKLVRGEAMVDSKGRLDIPAFNMYDAAGKYLAYNLEIDEGKDGDPIGMVLTFNAQDGTISAKGKGLDQFGGVSFKDQLATKADWAGIIQDPKAGHLNDLGTEQGFKVALLGDITSVMPGQNPKIIQVLAAPGGGQFSDPALNTFSQPYGCNDGIDPGPDYSFCDDDALNDQIDQIVANYVTALYMMGHQLTAVMAEMTLPIGAMIDAKFQLETQRELQLLTAEAHKDYHPSQMMCEFGSMVKSITTAEEKSVFEKVAINDILNEFYYNVEHTSGAEGFKGDVESRVKQFRTVYCDVRDNNDGLHFMCDHDQAPGGPEGGTDRARLNKDIDFRKTLDTPLTLDLDFAYAHETANTRDITDDEEDVIALAKNLYWPQVLPAPPGDKIIDIYGKYMNTRQVYAMTSVAHNTLATIAGMKSKTEPGTIGNNTGWNFMKSMMRNFNLTDPEINQYLGEYPSYYAQMEVLTKKMYQQPDFYTNLYDKPVNVKRINATMEAIQIMQDRDFYESALRREMLTSLLVEQALSKHVDSINGKVVSDVKNLERR